MNIALIAHDKRKELMVQFCISYCAILSKHNVCATAATGKIVAETTGLSVHRFLAGTDGGTQQISSRVSYDEIDMVILFRDPMQEFRFDSDEFTLLRLCDMYNIPVATNIATAEVLVRAMDRGDLEWREIFRSKKEKTELF